MNEAADKPVFLLPDLRSPQGNAFYLMGVAKREARKAGWHQSVIEVLIEEMMRGSYEDLLDVIFAHFTVVRQQERYDFITRQEVGGWS